MDKAVLDAEVNARIFDYLKRSGKDTTWLVKCAVPDAPNPAQTAYNWRKRKKISRDHWPEVAVAIGWTPNKLLYGKDELVQPGDGLTEMALNIAWKYDRLTLAEPRRRVLLKFEAALQEELSSIAPEMPLDESREPEVQKSPAPKKTRPQRQ